MKISKLYSNRVSLFTPIEFNDGLNVVYAKVTRPKDRTKDSHNLGKTLLIHVIDFLLLKELTKEHFLYSRKDIFHDFVCFLELRTNSGSFVTVRRGVEKNTKICIHRHPEPHQDLTDMPTDAWQVSDMPLRRARDKLNEMLGLTDIDPWDYRKGSGYFLRTQNDYRDVFQLSKFAVGKHRDWKPFMAWLLGFPHAAIERKYEIEERIQEKEQLRDRSAEITVARSEEYDRVKGTLEIKRSELKEARADIDQFNFYQQDIQDSTRLVDEIETEIAARNERLYTLDYELRQMKEALKQNVRFDVDKVQRVFQEANAAFPESLKRSYEQLVDFNKRLSVDRGRRVNEQITRLSRERGAIKKRLERLNKQRSEILSVIQDTDSLRKFRTLQKTLVQRETEIAKLETVLEQLDKVTSLDREIRELRAERERCVETIQDTVRRGNPTYQVVRREFNKIIRTILDLPGVISITINREGNLEFEANLLVSERSPIPTDEDKGASYRRLLCCAFDMALLISHKGGSFYRFVYHDGVFEGLDNRKKRQLLEIIRSVCDTHGMQYILTMIEADVPRDEEDKAIPFEQQEIILELFEGTDKGRLFKMPKF